MKRYYALFTKRREVVEVEFPDLPGCVTFGVGWDEAYENAVDVLAAWLAHAEMKFVKNPSSYENLEHSKGTLVPVPVDVKILESYEESKRFNVIFPASTLRLVDDYRKKTGLKRSTFLMNAAHEYLERHKTRKIA